jgi:hypothetical protein
MTEMSDATTLTAAPPSRRDRARRWIYFDNLGSGNEIDKTIPLAELRIEFRNLTSSRRGHF